MPGCDRGRAAACRSRGPATRSVVVAGSGKKTDMKKQGLSSVQNEVVKANLMGISRKMKDKNWVDSQGRKGKVRAGPAAHAQLARRAILLRVPCRGRRCLEGDRDKLAAQTPHSQVTAECHAGNALLGMVLAHR